MGLGLTHRRGQSREHLGPPKRGHRDGRGDRSRAMLVPVPSVGSDEHRRGVLAVMPSAGSPLALPTLADPANRSCSLSARWGLSRPFRWSLRGGSASGSVHREPCRRGSGTHVVVFWPFLRNSETFDTGLQSAVDGSPLDDFLIHWGIFLTISVFAGRRASGRLRRRHRAEAPAADHCPRSCGPPAVEGRLGRVP